MHAFFILKLLYMIEYGDWQVSEACGLKAYNLHLRDTYKHTSKTNT